jgi:hypothetical protein
LAAHNATVITIGAGTQIGAPTGGDKGVGTLNATGLFVNGVAVSAGSTSPGGADTQVQYNNAGAFAGSADFAWINGSRTLNIGSAGAGVVTPVVNASGTGRALTIRGGGTSNTSSSPGDLNISGGTNSVDGPGGNIFVNAGSGTGASGAAGGSVFVNGGSGVVGFSGGAVTITAGSGGSAAGNGADATLNGGNGGTTGGVGGNANIGGGTPTQGNGGSVLITGAAGVGTNRNGGSITLTSGAATGSGTVGKINLVSSSVVVNGGFLSLTGSTNGLSFTDTSAASTNQSWSIGNFSTQWHLRPCNDAVSSCGADSITVSRSANSTTTIALTGTSATSLTFNSGIIPSSGRIIWAVVTGAAGSCSVTSSSGLANTTCTRSGVGAYTLNPPSGFANNSPCTASAIRANGANITAEADGSSSTIGISTYTGSTGAAFEATSGVSVVCVSST